MCWSFTSWSSTIPVFQYFHHVLVLPSCYGASFMLQCFPHVPVFPLFSSASLMLCRIPHDAVFLDLSCVTLLIYLGSYSSSCSDIKIRNGDLRYAMEEDHCPLTKLWWQEAFLSLLMGLCLASTAQPIVAGGGWETLTQPVAVRNLTSTLPMVVSGHPYTFLFIPWLWNAWIYMGTVRSGLFFTSVKSVYMFTVSVNNCTVKE